MGEQLKNLKCIKQRIISGFFRTINNEFHGFRYYLTFFLTFYLNLKRNAGAFRSPPHPFGIKKDNNYEKILKIDFREPAECLRCQFCL